MPCHCYLSIDAWLHCIASCGDPCTRSLPALLAAAHAVWAVSDSCVTFTHPLLSRVLRMRTGTADDREPAQQSAQGKDRLFWQPGQQPGPAKEDHCLRQPRPQPYTCSSSDYQVSFSSTLPLSIACTTCMPGPLNMPHDIYIFPIVHLVWMPRIVRSVVIVNAFREFQMHTCPSTILCSCHFSCS